MCVSVCVYMLQSAAAAPSPVLGNLPPGEGMPVGPVPPGFFQVCGANTNTHSEYRKYQRRSPDHVNLQCKMIKQLHVCVGTTVCSPKIDRLGSNRRNVPLFCSPSEGLCRLYIDYPSLSVKLRRPHLTPRSIFSIGISQPCFQNLMLKQPFFIPL